MSETVDVVVDNREPPEVLTAVDQHDDVNDWRLDQLDIGDIRFEYAGVLIERKTPEDYAASVLSGRLDSQLHRMADAQDRPYVLVEGSISDFDSLEHTRIRSQSLRGHVASTMARRRVPVLFCDEMDLLVDMSVRLARKNLEAPSRSEMELVSAAGVESKSLSQTMRLFTAIDGVGPVTAQSLEDEFVSMEALVRANQSDLEAVEGIGDVTAADISEAISG
jgi:Fanconi anemia group M protein